MKNLILSLILITTQFVSAGTLSFKAIDGQTEFSAVGKPAMIKINGKGQGPEGDLTYTADKISGTLQVSLEKLTTEIDLRDDHMKNKYLEVKKFPTAEITFKEFKAPVTIDTMTDKETEVAFTGDFTMHGKTKAISGIAKIKKAQNTISGTAEFTIKIMEYLETLPSYMGLKVADDVKVAVKLKGTVK
jgi:polyisoprenoid-binding protein YceI